MNIMDKKIKVLVSGGGTGGHIFPAISIANAIKNKCPNADILFVGAENRMEMEKVPAAGYPIIGLPVSGFDRKHLLKNIKVLFRLFKIFSGYCSRCRRVCQRSYLMGCCTKGHSDIDSRTEFLCWCYQQITCI